MELRQIAKDVYACLQPDRGLGWSNSGFVDLGGGVVIDTFWDLPLTRRLIENYASVRKEPARRVVNTHHNGDHCWGNQLFEGAEIIGHRLCAASFGKERPEAMQALRESGGFGDEALSSFAKALLPFDFSGIVLTPPTTLMDERMELDLDGVAMELLYVGPAHTLGDVIVHLPEQRVVFAGDVLFRLCTPVGWEGTFAKWEEALDRIVALQPEIVVPGHGPLCDATGAREMKAYLQYVRSESRRFFDAGLPVIEAARRIDLGPYAGWSEPERLVFSVARAYRELQGEPADSPVDAAAMLRDVYALQKHYASAGK